MDGWDLGGEDDDGVPRKTKRPMMPLYPLPQAAAPSRRGMVLFGLPPPPPPLLQPRRPLIVAFDTASTRYHVEMLEALADAYKTSADDTRALLQYLACGAPLVAALH